MIDIGDIYSVYPIVGVVGLISAILGMIYIFWELSSRKIKMSGIAYRKKYGRFELDDYMRGTKTTLASTKQDNGGICPKDFAKKVKYVDSFAIKSIRKKS